MRVCVHAHVLHVCGRARMCAGACACVYLCAHACGCVYSGCACDTCRDCEGEREEVGEASCSNARTHAGSTLRVGVLMNFNFTYAPYFKAVMDIVAAKVISDSLLTGCVFANIRARICGNKGTYLRK